MKDTLGFSKMHDWNDVIVENLITINFKYNNHVTKYSISNEIKLNLIYTKKYSCHYWFTTYEWLFNHLL